jgi:hypothetical protein
MQIRPVAAEVAPAEIVREDENDVGPGLRGVKGSQRREQQGGEEYECVFQCVSVVYMAEVLSISDEGGHG